MRWIVEHRIEAPLERVEEVLLAPATLARVPEYVGTLREVVPIGRTEGPGFVERVAHYRPELGVALPAAVHPSMLEFDEHTRWDRSRHAAVFEIRPNLPERLRHRVRCGGTYSLRPDGAATIRRIEGELAIRAAVIGPLLERAGVRIIARQFEAEARMLGALAA